MSPILDEITEKEVIWRECYENYDTIKHGSTIITICHKLNLFLISSLANCVGALHIL